MLGRLRVQQKLTALLLLPLIAVVVVSVPFTMGRVDEAVAASTTVGRAEQARQVALLMQDLQEERLLALTYLVSKDADREALRLAIAASTNRTEQVISSLEASKHNELRSALRGLDRLGSIRAEVIRGKGTPADLDKTYHELVTGLVRSLGLGQQSGADATGLRQMGTFDALLKINEDITRLGAALVIGTVDAQKASQLIADTLVLVEADIARFRQQADPEQSALLALVVQGQTAQRINEYARQIATGGLWVTATKALTAAEAALMLTRALQERVARDIADQAAARAGEARFGAGSVVGFVGLLVIGVVLLSAAMSRAIAQPLRRLTGAASTVADLARAELVRVADSEVEESRPPRLVAVPVATTDEIGELAQAFNRVQATAALLMEQQVATRRNTAVMFANIARRTRSLVARQLGFIDDLERNERDEKALAKLYRLDHLTTRLHRSADSLLVISGVREEDRIVEPARLVDVIRSAIAEIEGYQVVEVGSVCPVMISPELVPDLRLVIAELLENASSFSPPTARVDIRARYDGDVEIVVVDRGIGMSDERLEEENRRLVERERLDVAPTSVLGLFVVGRLARRHGLRVRLRRGAPQGTMVEVRIPPALFVADGATPAANLELGAGQAGLADGADAGATRELPKIPTLPHVPGSFNWFGDLPPAGSGEPGGSPGHPGTSPHRVPSGAFPVVRRPLTPPPVAGRSSAPPPVPEQRPGPPAPAGQWAGSAVPEQRSGPPSAADQPFRAPQRPTDRWTPQAPPDGDAANPSLTRRTPGDHLQYFGFEAPREPYHSASPRDAEAERDQLDAFARATAEATTALPTYSASPYPPPPAAPGNGWGTAPTEDRTFIPEPAVSAVPAPAEPPAPVPMNASRGGLTRRVPGSHLSPALRTEAPVAASRSVARNAEAERDALHSFLDGLARAESHRATPSQFVDTDESE